MSVYINGFLFIFFCSFTLIIWWWTRSSVLGIASNATAREIVVQIPHNCPNAQMHLFLDTLFFYLTVFLENICQFESTFGTFAGSHILILMNVDNCQLDSYSNVFSE